MNLYKVQTQRLVMIVVAENELNARRMNLKYVWSFDLLTWVDLEGHAPSDPDPIWAFDPEEAELTHLGETSASRGILMFGVRLEGFTGQDSAEPEQSDTLEGEQDDGPRNDP